jgi:hypothetical protein
MTVARRRANGFFAQRGDGIALRVEATQFERRLWRMQQIALFSDQQENQPIDEAEQLCEILRERQRPAVKLFPQLRVCVGGRCLSVALSPPGGCLSTDPFS